MRRWFAAVTTLVAATLFTACASEPLPGEEGYEEYAADQAVGSGQQGIIGYTPNVGLAGIVLITVQGDATSHTGMLVAPNLVVTSKDILNPRPSASRVTVEVGLDYNHPTGTVFPVAQIMHHPGARLAYLRLSSAVAGNRTPMDTRVQAPNLTSLACFAYEGRVLKRANMRVASTTADSVSLDSTAFHAIQAADDGAACIELGGAGSVVGLAVGPNFLVPGKVAADYAPIATQLFPIAAQSGRFQLSNGNGNCATIPGNNMGEHALLEARTCAGSAAQLYYFDYRVSSTGPAIVSAMSGKCLDVWDNSPVAGMPIQTYTCHGGRNQSWTWFLHNPQGSGFAYVSGVVPFGSSSTITSALRCLSTRASGQLESNACITGSLTNHGQRWFITWRN